MSQNREPEPVQYTPRSTLLPKPKPKPEPSSGTGRGIPDEVPEVEPVPVQEYWAHPVDQSVSSTTSGPASGTASGGYQTFDLTNSQHPRIRFSRWWCPHHTSARPAGSTREGPLLLLLLVLLLFTRTRLPPMRVRVQALCTKSKWCKSCKSSLRRFLSRLCSCFSVVLIRPHRKTQL